MTRRQQVRRRKVQNRLRRDWRWARSVMARALETAASEPVDMAGLRLTDLSYWASVIIANWRKHWPEVDAYLTAFARQTRHPLFDNGWRYTYEVPVEYKVVSWDPGFLISGTIRD